MHILLEPHANCVRRSMRINAMEPWDYFCVWTNLILTVVANLVLKGASQCTCSTTQCFMIMYHVNNS